MKISLGADHRGYELKGKIKKYLTQLGHEMTDFGTNSTESVDYPDFGFKVAESVARGEADFGVVVCLTGNGMNIVANKVKGVRSALCLNEEMAMLTRAHNNANVLALASNFVSEEMAKKILDVWLATDFEGGRHKPRVDKINNYQP
ncbi:MAG: ribose 5-phosphate isomerase [candidate division Zixibacteria bacterium SM23_73_3]|nr:MAG: ribose 5-phosphate isomerase [candidate division Zixibacteria bacterium SM23_73_3]